MIVALAGGVGGSKLVLGLSRIVPREKLAVVVNTGDDDDFYGLRVCPDLDTVMYTLAGVVHPEQGWGVADERFDTLEMLRRYGAPGWFRLGNKDLATHLLRSQWLREGARLTEVTAKLSRGLGVREQILPMTDARVATRLTIADENGRGVREATFQEYFVQRRWQDRVHAVRFAGVEAASVPSEVRQALAGARVIIVCPSNPVVSVEPILSVPGMRQALQEADCPRIALSPIVGRQAVSGPAARLMEDLGRQPSAAGVAELYADCLTHFALDERDAAAEAAVRALGLEVVLLDSVMKNVAEKEGLARRVLESVGVEA